MTIEQKIREEGMLQGIEKGQLQAKKSIATNLIKEGMPLPQISKVTGLTLLELQALKISLN